MWRPEQGYEHPAEQFKRLAEELFKMAMTTLEESSPPHAFFPILLPFSERDSDSGVDGPGELLTFAANEPDAAFEQAVATIHEHAQQWVGYVFVRKTSVHAGDKTADALLLEAWFYSNCLHVMRRFESHEAGVQWREPPTMVSGQNPPTHLLTPTRVVAPDGFVMVRDLLASLASATTSGLTGECEQDWSARVSALQLPSEETIVPSYTWADLARKMARLDTLHAMGAPAIIFEAEMDVACSQLAAMAALTKQSS